MPVHLPRTLFRALLVMLLAAAPLVASSAAEAQGLARNPGMESSFLAGLNAQRAAVGAAPLTLNGSMSAAAAGWTAQMVDGSFLAHASDIVSGTPAGWTKVGENVGRGQSVSSLTQSFMNSASHARNVLDPAFTHVGIAVIVHPDGRVYTTHRFAALPTAAPAPVQPAPAPTAAPTPAPAPAQPAPAPTPAQPAQPAPAPTPAPTPDSATPKPEVAIAETADLATEIAQRTPDAATTSLGQPPELLAFAAEQDWNGFAADLTGRGMLDRLARVAG